MNDFAPHLDVATPGALQRALVATLAGARTANVAVAVNARGQLDVASVGPQGAAALPVGCLAKLLTATLAGAAVHERRLSLDADTAVLLGKEAAPLGGITLRHLLEHTHGLDDSLLDPPQHGGRPAADDFVRRVGALPRCAPPGRLYSYGNVGAWLVGVLLERVRARAFATLVDEELLAPLGISGPKGLCCPAMGGALALTAAELAALAARMAARLAALLGMAEPPAYAIAPLPGWNPLERGVVLGWKYSGSGWLGHQSAWPGASVYVRAQPAREITLVVTSRELPAAVVAGRLFGKEFPELFDFKARDPLRRASHEAHWPGTYERAAHIVHVERARGGLTLNARSRDGRGVLQAPLVATLCSAADGICFAQPASELLPFVQFVDPLVGEPGYLWNGRFVFRRTGA